jgi:septum formation protein
MLVLASASPRRRQLLAQAGFTFQVHPADIPEDPLPGEDPTGYVSRLAREKAQVAFSVLRTERHASHTDPLPDPLVVLGADTTVTIDDAILAKPEDAADAVRMLRLLSGRTHRVITGVAVVTADAVDVATESTSVTFLPMSEGEIATYVSTGEPMDKAGAYAIQGFAARWIPRIEGCYFNVVGLPLSVVSTLLANRGIIA